MRWAERKEAEERSFTLRNYIAFGPHDLSEIYAPLFVDKNTTSFPYKSYYINVFTKDICALLQEPRD